MSVQEYLTVESVQLEPGKEWLRHREVGSRGLLFFFPDSGTGEISDPSGRTLFKAGDVLIARGDATIQIRPIESGIVRFSLFSVLPEHLIPVLAGAELPHLRLLEDRLDRPRLYPAEGEVAQECHLCLRVALRETGFDRRCRLLRLVGIVLQAETDPRLRLGAVRNGDQMRQALGALTVGELSRLTVAELARKLGCGRRQLNRLFQQYVGCSLADLKMEMRLVYAASLLRDPAAKITAVAEESGFNHLGLFSIRFKRRFGMNPGEFRRHVIAQAEQTGCFTADPGCWMSGHGLCPWSNQGR